MMKPSKCLPFLKVSLSHSLFDNVRCANVLNHLLTGGYPRWTATFWFFFPPECTDSKHLVNLGNVCLVNLGNFETTGVNLGIFGNHWFLRLFLLVGVEILGFSGVCWGGGEGGSKTLSKERQLNSRMVTEGCPVIICVHKGCQRNFSTWVKIHVTRVDSSVKRVVPPHL